MTTERLGLGILEESSGMGFGDIGWGGCVFGNKGCAEVTVDVWGNWGSLEDEG